MKFSPHLFYIILAIFISACNQGANGDRESDQKHQEEAIEQGDENEEEQHAEKPGNRQFMEQGALITAASMKALKQTLSIAIQQGGVTNAIEVCSEYALDLTDSLSGEYGVKISRVSHKNRNPRNQANARELELINSYKDSLSRGEEIHPRLVSYEEKKIYYTPIMISNELCLNCHGSPEEDIPEEAYITLQMLYPDDNATGFAMGDMRGLWKVAFNNPEM